MASIFSKIIAGEIPCYKIAENAMCFAFLDINPVVRGHVLVVPKEEVDYIFDLEDGLLGELMAFSKKVGLALEKVVPCERVGLTVIGLEVPHAHVHLMPIRSVRDMEFGHKRVQMTKEEMQALADDIGAAMA